MNRFQKLMRAAATTVIVLTVGSVLGNDVDSQNFSVKHPTKSFYTCCLMELSEGLAAFRNPLERPSKWGYVDSSGEVVIKPQFDTAGIFSEGLAAVEINGEYGFIDKSGKLVIYPQYTTVSGFTEGVAVVSKSNLHKSLKNVKNFRVGAIDKQGKLVIDYLYEDIHPFSEGLAAAKKIGSNKYGYIDKNGIEIIKASFDSAYGFREGKAAVSIVDKKSKIKKIGFVNRYGEYVIKPQFNHEVSSFSEGLAAVLMKIDGKFKVGFIDEKGNFVINPQYDSAENFSEGLAAVRIGDADNGRVGFIDKSGNMVINPQFKHVLFQRFHEGFSRVSIGNKNEKSKWGFIDKKGKFFVNPEFEYATDFVGDFALVGFDENKVGFLKKIPLESALRKLNVVTTLPDQNGLTVIQIEASADTASLKINGEEQGGRADGKYSIKKIARAGGDTQFTIVATDTNGNIDTKTITVSRPITESKPIAASLNPAQVKKQAERDAVAIIIGIADYKNLPRADYANDDARVFYDYAVRALGVKPENIRLLVDEDADDVAIYRAFKTWLPSRVQANTDVYVFYSGHGLPTADGQGLYVLPQRAHRDFVDKTAITQAEINAAIQAAKPKSVTIFLDACYSGQARTGETLLASARPVALKMEKQLFPDSFTVISASQADQISSSSPDLKHGIFSYYLMRGMEGDADANKDGRITAGEMHTYLTEQVARQAGMMNRQQVPQLVGDANRVLVGR